MIGRESEKGTVQPEGGFTLLEVMVAIAILSFGILAVATMQSNAIRSNFRGYHLTEATTLAQDRIEYLTTQPFDNLVAGLDQADPDPDNPRPDIHYDVVEFMKEDPTDPSSDITAWLITVKVQLQGERAREITFIRIPMKGA
jgi:type IV pilus assembly protein PilV